MSGPFGVEHISKLSGYDYNYGKDDYTVASRVGWTESDKPGKQLSHAAGHNAKRAGRLKLLKPKSWKKANRTKAASEAREKTLASGRATRGPATPGKYTEQVWEHKQPKTGKTHHTTGAGGETPYKGKYRTWDRKDLNRAAPGYKVAKREGKA